METKTNIINRLSSSLGRRDEVPNQEIANEIVLTNDNKAVQILIDNLSGKKAIQNDCIKVLYEVGEQAPLLIADNIEQFVAHLKSKNNRLQWGAMTALSAITNERPKEIYAELTNILSAADTGSVITKDQAVNILIKLCAIEQYADNAFTLLIEQLLKSPTNQLPMYAERSLKIINDKNKSKFVSTLSTRLNDIEKETKRKRIEKIIKKLT